MPSTARQVALAIVGIALLVGGGMTVSAGVDSVNSCGKYRLVAERVETVDQSERYVRFGNLTAGQQELARHAINGESPTVESEAWPWLESALYLTYEGNNYVLYTVTAECPFPPMGIVVVGVVSMVLGVGAFVPFVRHRRSASPDR